MRVGDGGALDSPVAKFLVRGRAGARSSTRSGAEPGDLLLLVADEWIDDVRGARPAAQRPRPPAGARGRRTATCGSSTSRCSSGVDDDGRPMPAHHPFTMPAPRRHRPARVRPDVGALARPTTSCSTAGSSARAAIRIHEPDMQQRDLRPARHRRRGGAARASASSSTPFRYGAPPHGGFAFGIDRLVAILAGEENIREVIAFPKTQSGADPMTGAPTPVDAEAARRPRPAPPAPQLLTAR